jgi:hypothetical protein
MPVCIAVGAVECWTLTLDDRHRSLVPRSFRLRRQQPSVQDHGAHGGVGGGAEILRPGAQAIGRSCAVPPLHDESYVVRQTFSKVATCMIRLP